jgi:hypothetical protein
MLFPIIGQSLITYKSSLSLLLYCKKLFQFFANKENMFVYFVVYMETGYLEWLFRATFS